MTTVETLKAASPPLQPGAELLPEVRTVTVGTLVPQKVDATINSAGLTWFRVYGGFGGRFDREDWIADLPAISVSVCDYHWNGSDFGPSYDSFENACRGQMEFALRSARHTKSQMEAKLTMITAGIAQLERCLGAVK